VALAGLGRQLGGDGGHDLFRVGDGVSRSSAEALDRRPDPQAHGRR
jgi:hypothetical protein